MNTLHPVLPPSPSKLVARKLVDAAFCASFVLAIAVLFVYAVSRTCVALPY
jgi:hypothetical protein